MIRQVNIENDFVIFTDEFTKDIYRINEDTISYN